MIGPLLRTRRWIGFTVLVAVSITAFGVLSAWQWSRAEDRRAERESLQAASEAAPMPLTDATRGLAEWTAVEVSGTYGSDQVVVRKRPFQAQNGFWVMAHASRTDFAMLLGLFFLVIVGAGPLSWDARGAGASRGRIHS